MSLRRHGKWHMALPRQAILTWQCWERWSISLWTGNLLTSLFLRAWACDVVGHAAGPHTLELGHRLDVGEAGAHREPRRLQLGAGEAARGTV